MSHIYISYRRGDTSEAAREIYAHLDNLGFDVWMDTNAVPPGKGVRKSISKAMNSTGAMIAVIGPTWLQHIHDEGDFVREELEGALERTIPIIPALVDGARMPRTSELPRTLRELPYLNVAVVKGPPLVRDMEPLTRAMTPLASRVSRRPARARVTSMGAKGDIASPPPGSASRPSGSSSARDTNGLGVSNPPAIKRATSMVIDAWISAKAMIVRKFLTGRRSKS